LTIKQRTADWFLACQFSFSSTTLHVHFNVIETVYFDNEALKDLHQKCKDKLKLYPRQSITIDNAASLDDDDVPNQRSDLIVNRGQVANHSNCTKEFWRQTCKKKALRSINTSVIINTSSLSMTSS